MFPFIENVYKTLPFDFFTEAELVCLIPGTDASRYGIIKRAMAKGELIRIRRGVYCLSNHWQRTALNFFALAHRCYNPSYISLESALSFHNLIPEAVYATTSVCLKRSVQFQSPIGVFSYTRHSRFNMQGVERLMMDNLPVLMAKPAKAIVDYVLCYKKNWTTIEPLMQSLRIDENDLLQIPIEDFSALIPYYQSRRLEQFIEGLSKEFAS